MVNGAGGVLLANAGFTEDQDRHLRLRQATNQLVEADHARIGQEHCAFTQLQALDAVTGRGGPTAPASSRFTNASDRSYSTARATSSSNRRRSAPTASKDRSSVGERAAANERKISVAPQIVMTSPEASVRAPTTSSPLTRVPL